MQAVLDAPVDADHPGEVLGVGRQAGEIVPRRYENRLWCYFAADVTPDPAWQPPDWW